MSSLPEIRDLWRGTMLNNAATTPPFSLVLKAVDQMLWHYSTFHRGLGPEADKTYRDVVLAMQTIRQFVNCPEDHVLVFTQNTSAAINLLARLLRLKRTDVVLLSETEHTSNHLPWKYNTKAQVVYAKVFDDGALDYDSLREQSGKHKGRLRVVAMTGASNLTGFVPDLAKLSRAAHDNGAMLFIDAAQLAPHRPIDMQAQGIDALAFSAHKLYAPFGLGVLVIPRWLAEKAPIDPAGGSIDMLGDNGAIWSHPEMRHTTGTWNVTGIVALAESCSLMMKTGWETIMSHERQLLEYAVSQMAGCPKLQLYVPLKKYLDENRIGTLAYNIQGYHHALVSAVLAHEHSIETRAGTICNHRLVRRWLKVSDSDQTAIEGKIRQGDLLASYGVVRASIGIGNQEYHLRHLFQSLASLIDHGPEFEYEPHPRQEIFLPVKK